MKTHDVETLIFESLNLHADAAINRGDLDTPDRIESLASILRNTQTDLLTNDAGLVLRFDNGTEFDITIVRRN